ncbi:MAG: MXAN_5187 C-terminal domain-containing protein [Sandaracinaceae bacterium]
MDLKEFDANLHDAEIKLKRLKALYEQWFQGIEKMEPVIPKKDLDRQLLLMNKEKPRNTAARFRLQQLQARYNTYLTYWSRIGRQIEEGTYKRDVNRARRMRGRAVMSDRPGPRPAHELDLDQEIDVDVDVDLDDGDDQSDIDAAINALVAKQQSLPAPARSTFSAFSPMARPRPAPTAPPAAAAPVPTARATFGKPMSRPPNDAVARSRSGGGNGAHAAPPVARAAPPDRTREIYDQYIAARRRNNESTDNVAYDKLAASISKMKTQLREKHGDKRIDFEVVVQNGRVGLKPKIG